MAASGAPADRVTSAVGAAIASWADEADMDAATARARVEQVWDSVGKDAADLEAAISDAEGSGGQGLVAAKRSLAALQAAVAALAAAHDRLQ